MTRATRTRMTLIAGTTRTELHGAGRLTDPRWPAQLRHALAQARAMVTNGQRGGVEIAWHGCNQTGGPALTLTTDGWGRLSAAGPGARYLAGPLRSPLPAARTVRDALLALSERRRGRCPIVPRPTAGYRWMARRAGGRR